MLVDTKGETINAQDAIPAEEEIEKIRNDVESALKDEEIQLFAQSYVVGKQLAEWGKFFIAVNKQLSRPAKAAILNLLETKVYDPSSGTPHKFTTDQLLKNLDNILPRIEEVMRKKQKNNNGKDGTHDARTQSGE